MQIDPSKVRWDDAPASAPIDASQVRWDDEKPGVVKSAVMGVARGAKDVVDTGAQWLASGFDKLAGTKEGERVQQMNDAGKADFQREYRGSTAADIGRLGGNIAATWPVGGVLGKGVQLAGHVFKAGKVVEPVAQAIASGGMRAGGVTGAAGLAARAAGGAVSGGAMAGLVDPESAATGAVIGAALPGAIQLAKVASAPIGRLVHGSAVPEKVLESAAAAQKSGYVLPPTQVKPSLGNRLMEGVAGKTSTQQNASVRNQVVTDRLARSALGLPEDAALDLATMQRVRQQAGQAYQQLRNLGEVVPDDKYRHALADIASSYRGASASFPGLADDAVGSLIDSMNVGRFNADGAVDAMTILRNRADKAFASGDKGLAKATKGVSAALEDLLERHAQQVGSPEAVRALKDARQLIAKSYSVEKALNPALGSVSAKKLAQQLYKGKPLSGELGQIAEFGAAFPTAAQQVERMGSLPQLSPLDWAVAGTASAAQGPVGMLGLLARPAARSAALSGPVQRGLLSAESLGVPSAASDFSRGLLGFGVRSAPLLSSSR